MSKTMFVFKRIETVHYWLEWSREEVIENLVWILADDEKSEQHLSSELSSLTDEQLLQRLQESMDENDDVYCYVVERSEKYGDVQSNDIFVKLNIARDDA